VRSELPLSGNRVAENRPDFVPKRFKLRSAYVALMYWVELPSCHSSLIALTELPSLGVTSKQLKTAISRYEEDGFNDARCTDVESLAVSLARKRLIRNLVPLRLRLCDLKTAVVYWNDFPYWDNDEVAIKDLKDYGVEAEQLQIAISRYEKSGFKADCTDAIGDCELVERSLNAAKSNFTRVKIKYRAQKFKCLPYAILNIIPVNNPLTIYLS
jgi:hypothetical protein